MRWDELPNPVREDFLLENKNGKIQRKEVSNTLKELFVDSEKSSYAPYFSNKDKMTEKIINVSGREEHEAIIRDSAKCKELGLDQIYETIVYLRRWGSWLENETLP
jgi:hypothetical protein